MRFAFLKEKMTPFVPFDKQTSRKSTTIRHMLHM